MTTMLTSKVSRLNGIIGLGGSMKRNGGRAPKPGRRRLVRQNSRLAWDARVTAPSIKLDLEIECRRLPKKNSFSQADAFCCIWELPSGYRSNDRTNKKVSRLPTPQEREVGRTEVVRENKNPTFTTKFSLEYKFHEEQTYVVRVYNEDLRYATDLKEHDYIGGCVFTLGELLGANGCSIARPLQHGKAFVIMKGIEVVETRECFEFRFSGAGLGLLEHKSKKAQVAKEVLENLEKLNVAKTVLDRFDVYFQLEKLNFDDQSWKVAWKSEVVKDNQDPTWNVARIPLQVLCDDEPNNPLKITIWVWNRFTPDDLVGFVETTVAKLVKEAQRGIPVFDVMMEKKKLFGGTKLKKAGVLKVLKGNILEVPSFLQFMAGGCRMDLMFAVDCTYVNKDWRDEQSLHYHSSTLLNDYQVAIYKIAKIYDVMEGPHDFTLWGYGEVARGNQQHYFTMGENLKNADELLNAYDNTFSNDNYMLKLGDEAEISLIIQAAIYRSIRLSRQRQSYSTLVILTAGLIDDLQETIDQICAAAEDAPLSIIIVGVGDGDFSEIQRLTGDESGKLLHSNGVPIARDIVHFVAFSDYNGYASMCVAEALREIPEQVVQHFINAGIKPAPPKVAPDFSKAIDGGRNQSPKREGNGRKEAPRDQSNE